MRDCLHFVSRLLIRGLQLLDYKLLLSNRLRQRLGSKQLIVALGLCCAIKRSRRRLALRADQGHRIVELDLVACNGLGERRNARFPHRKLLAVLLRDRVAVKHVRSRLALFAYERANVVNFQLVRRDRLDERRLRTQGQVVRLRVFDVVKRDGARLGSVAY